MNLNFDKYSDGLIPAIVQDASTHKVLMLGFMDQAAWEKTQKEKQVTFFSRSKSRLWTKGETSGNFLDVVDLSVDCDQDTILVKANPRGPVCHTGSDTCFNEKNQGRFVSQLEGIINDRFDQPSEKSYVNSLRQKGVKKMAQKVGEEGVEVALEALGEDDELFLNESADLVFHLLVLLRAKGHSFADVEDVLRSRMK